MFSLPPTVVRDDYIQFDCPRSSYILVNVYNGGVYCGVGRQLSGRGDPVYPINDLFLAPGSNPIMGADALRFRRADRSSTDTRVTVQAQLDEELPKETSLTAIYTPNYLTLGNDGRVSADFSGVIRALGVTLPADDTGLQSPRPDSAVRWINELLGLQAAQIFGSSQNRGSQTGADELLLNVGRGRSFPGADTALRMSRNDILRTQSVGLIHDGGRYGQTTLLQNHDGFSDFVQWNLPSNPYRIDVGSRGPGYIANPQAITQYQFQVNGDFDTEMLAVITSVWYAAPIAEVTVYSSISPTFRRRAFVDLYLLNPNPFAVDIGIHYIAVGY